MPFDYQILRMSAHHNNPGERNGKTPCEAKQNGAGFNMKKISSLPNFNNLQIFMAPAGVRVMLALVAVVLLGFPAPSFADWADRECVALVRLNTNQYTLPTSGSIRVFSGYDDVTGWLNSTLEDYVPGQTIEYPVNCYYDQILWYKDPVTGWMIAQRVCETQGFRPSFFEDVYSLPLPILAENPLNGVVTCENIGDFINFDDAVTPDTDNGNDPDPEPCPVKSSNLKANPINIYNGNNIEVHPTKAYFVSCKA